MKGFTVIGYDECGGYGFCEHVCAQGIDHAIEIAKIEVALRRTGEPGHEDEYHAVTVLVGHVEPPYVTEGRTRAALSRAAGLTSR